VNCSHWHQIHQKELETLWKASESLSVQQSKELDKVAKALELLREQMETAEDTSKRTLQFLKSSAEIHHIKPDNDLLAAGYISFLEKSLSNLHLSTTDLKKQQIILNSLGFENRSARYSSIPEAHRKTFRWAFNEKPATPSADLLEWLKHGDQIFWVSGKPGSGKSTFMKFAAGYAETEKALATWSYPKRAIIASHYFWCSGTTIQKSQQGLLQTLLFDIFRQCPDLIPVVCRERWSSNCEDSGRPWEVSELHGALQGISEKQALGVKFCFFIDGLDEYEGDHLEFCSALKTLSTSAHIKLCLASRPWNAFQDAFGQSYSKLYIHYLTCNDIEAYTTDRLQTHPRWKDIKAETPNPEWLIQETVKRSSGVFLWVFLVTKLLREGLTEYNSFWDLRKRLESFPSDLEQFFKHILETVEPFHHNKMATTLSIAVARGEPMDIMIYHFHDLEYEYQDYAIIMQLEKLGGRTIKTMDNNIARQLNGRCRGLLEVDKSRKVSFLHRTVADFLSLREMSSFLAKKLPSGFSTNLSLLKAFIAFVKSRGFRNLQTDISALRKSPHSNYQMHQIFVYAGLAAEENNLSKMSSCRLLDDLDGWIMTVEEENDNSYTVAKFRDLVLKFNLLDYLRFKLPKNPSYLSICTNPALIQSAFSMYPSLELEVNGAGDKEAWSSKTIDMLQYLLEHGQDSNKIFWDPKLGRMTTPWAVIISKMIGHGKVTNYPFREKCFLSGLQRGLFTSFLSNGAQPNARVHRQEDYLADCLVFGSVAWADFLFTCFDLPTDIGYESMYLDVLGDFMLGADFNEIGERLGLIYPGTWNFKDSSFQGGIYCKFFTHLQALSTDGSSWINKRLLAEVTDMVLSKSDGGGLWLESTWPIIEQVFPDKVVRRLKNKYAKESMSTTAVSEGSVRGKRDREDNIGGPQQKKQVIMDPHGSFRIGVDDRDIE
jgi:hypothetical protein